MRDFEYQTNIPVPADDLFNYHNRAGAFQRLCPPWERLQIKHREGGIEDGGVLAFNLLKGPLRIRWVARHEGFIPGARFVDVQEKGPFAFWRHEHMMIPDGAHSILHDKVQYALPLGFIGDLFGGGLTEKKLKAMFRFRHQRTALDLVRHQRFAGETRKQIVLCGRDTHLTRALAAFLDTGGHDVYCLRPRLDGRGSEYRVENYFSGTVAHPLEDADALIYCDPFNRRKDPQAADLVEQLQFLNTTVSNLGTPPKCLIHLHPPLRKDTYTPNPFLEAAPSAERHLQIEEKHRLLDDLRDMMPRDVVLHCGEIIRGPMAYMVAVLMRLETFLFLGDGARSPSFFWISQEDVLGAVLHVLHQDTVDGDVAVIAPEPITRADLQQAMIRRGYGAYIYHRMLKVTPWSSPGRPPGMNPTLAELTNLSEKGFRPLARTLDEALALTFGDDFAPSANR